MSSPLINLKDPCTHDAEKQSFVLVYKSVRPRLALSLSPWLSHPLHLSSGLSVFCCPYRSSNSLAAKLAGDSGKTSTECLCVAKATRASLEKFFFLFANGSVGARHDRKCSKCLREREKNTQSDYMLLCSTDCLVSDPGTLMCDYSPRQQCQHSMPDIIIHIYFVVRSWHGKMFFCFDYIS